jgi:putative membrane protein
MPLLDLVHPEGLALVLVAGFLARHARAAARARGEPFGSGAALAASLALMSLALAGPLPTLADRYLFSAHMLQFVLLTKIAAPLLLWGLPPGLWRQLSQVPMVGSAWRVATRPWVAVTVFSALFTALQLPGVLDASLASNALYEFEQLLQLVAALWLWWPVTPLASPALSLGGRLLYLLVAMEFMMPAAFWLLFLAGHPVYAVYVQAPRLTWSPMSDQQLGALLMLVGMVGSFGAWALREVRHGPSWSMAAWYE